MGRLSQEKQVDKIIRAFCNAAAGRRLDWDLHIYGDGPMKGDLEQAISKSGLQHRIYLKGRTTEPWKVMAEADAFVMASSYEGFPNTLLEAMGVGLPSVVFDCPSGPREISEDGQTALLVPLNDEHALMSALLRVMSDEVFAKTLGIQARESVRLKFSLASVLTSWDRIFAEVGA
jgi:glycosyltransferase involved in cell wall biosynthesis